jgi:vitamin B12 transporter
MEARMLRSTTLALGIVGGSILAGAHPSTAQPSSADPSPSPFTDQLVVTATLEEAPRPELSSSLDVLPSEEIHARQAVSIGELVATTPGATLLASGGPGRAGSLFLRGADSNQTLVLWNGIALNDPLYGGFDFAFLPADGTAKVEIVRGPASSLYGSHAIAGVIQVLTAARQGGTLRLEAGENAYRRGSLAAGRSFGAWQADLVALHREGDGEVPNDDFASDDGLLRLDWQAREGVRVGLLGRANESEVGLPWSYGQLQLRQRSAWEEWQVAVPVEVVAGAWSLDGRLSQFASELAYRNPDDPFFTRGDGRGRASRARAAAVRRFAPTWGDGWIGGGGEWERQTARSESNFGTEIDDETRRSWASFVESSLAVGNLRLEAGLRRDDDQRFGQHLSPRAGLVWAARSDLRLRASWGEGFRAPALGELFYPFSGNPELEPEESRSFELAVDYQPGAFAFSLAAFDNRQTNLIDYDFVANRNVNVGRAESRGVELSARFAAAWFAAELNASRLDAKDARSDQPLLRRPEQSANLVLRATPGAFTLFAVGRFVGERPDRDAATFALISLPSYTRVDLGARWALRSWLEPFARVENVADRDYQEIAGYPAPRRTFVGGLAVSF